MDPDTSVFSVIDGVKNPIAGLGRTVGKIAIKLLEDNGGDGAVVFQFVASLLLPFNVLIEYRPTPVNGFVTFILSTPRTDNFCKDVVYGPQFRFLSRFKLRTDLLTLVPFGNAVYEKLRQFTWSTLCGLINNSELMPDLPKDIFQLNSLLVDLEAQIGMEPTGTAAKMVTQAQAIRKCLEVRSDFDITSSHDASSRVQWRLS